MELQLDLKVLQTIDELHSTDFRIAKDRGGPVFITQEDDTMFFLTAHLKGYTKDNIKIDINENGTQISISGNKTVQETTMKGWVMQEEEPRTEGFMKVYKIPKGVILDEIKADYNNDDLKLTIYMPKQKKGIIGGEIEEVKGEEPVDEVFESSHEEQASENNVKDMFDQEEETMLDDNEGNEITEVVPKLKGKIQEDMPLMKKDDKDVSSIQEIKGKDDNVIQSNGGKEEDEIVEERLEEGCETKDETKACETKQDKCNLDQHELEESKNDSNKCKLFAPCFFIGSTLIPSLVAMFLRLVKTKKH